MHKRRIAALVALAVGLMLIPIADASAYSKKDKKTEKKQNARITRVVKSVTALTVKVSKQGTLLATTTATADDVNKRLHVIEAGVPTIVKGLGDLKTGLEAAGAGLTSLKTLATSTEYGFAQVLVTQPAIAAEAGSFVETPDIPDTVQQAQSTQQFVAQHTGNLIVAYGVRSAESDGTGASNPAALCKVTVTQGNTTQTTAANPAIGGLPFQPVNNKSALTSTDPANASFPFGLKQTGPDADQTTNYVSTVGVTAGDTYSVGLACVDTSPSATDPSA
jgi:hypothetical protein